MRSAVRIRPAAPHKPCNHNGYRVCFVLSFLGFVGLSNRFSNKLFLCLFLQRRNDQFGDVGVFLQQSVCLFRGVIQQRCSAVIPSQRPCHWRGNPPFPLWGNGLPRQSVPQGHLLRGADWLVMTRCVGADDQSLPLRGRWQREALAEGETSRGFLSPSRLRRQPPHRGGLAARRCRADGTSYPKGICSAALHCRTPPPTLGLPHLSVGRDPCVPPQNTAFVPAGHTGPALQGGSTDSRRKKNKALAGFLFLHLE